VLTVCTSNAAILRHLKAGGSAVHFEAAGKAVVSAGPTIEQARTHVTSGGFGTPEVTLALATPRGEQAVAIHGAGQFASGSPPDAGIRYHIDCSTDGAKTWQPVDKGWQIRRRGQEPYDCRW